MNSTIENLQVIYEDNHLVIINKRVGDLVQGDKTGDIPLNELIKVYLAKKYNKKGKVFLGVVHRLDRPTSGVLIFARTSKALERLNKMLREKKINKIYWALVKNKPEKEQDRLIHYLKKNPKNNKTTVFSRPTPESKEAILDYKIINTLDNYFHLEINLETGRHHQIRAQLAYIGSPIKGDLKYGFNRSNPNGGIHLHAREVNFTHPVTKEAMTFTAKPPNDALWNDCLKTYN